MIEPQLQPKLETFAVLTQHDAQLWSPAWQIDAELQAKQLAVPELLSDRTTTPQLASFQAS